MPVFRVAASVFTAVTSVFTVVISVSRVPSRPMISLCALADARQRARNPLMIGIPKTNYNYNCLADPDSDCSCVHTLFLLLFLTPVIEELRFCTEQNLSNFL